MLSILIPVYNYKIKNLLISLDNAFEIIDFDYEILCWEDGSVLYSQENKAICKSIENANHLISVENKGRITSRKSLAQKAKYDWLLFLDADVIPESKDFIERYFEIIKKNNYEAIYGGICYDSETPESEYILRWKYGRKYEQIEAKKRNKHPYKHIVSSNFLIKKNIFLKICSQINNDGYGYDLFFGALMKSHKSNIYHIDNSAIHKGLDKNAEFLKKTEIATQRLYELYNHEHIRNTENSLLKLFEKIKELHLRKIIATTFFIFKKPLTKQLLSTKPNIKLLQFYKLGYLSSLTF
ncbi:glycosyltransferase family 2 protein [Winogradskyella flava]|uniref:Glycosyltransferase family 2 protein n=1 Tax=Winogradskyella flava TaxID=1884876 RepID=A0A842ISU0_9FLAO|nr:glycosyltransferase family 2 protein [Winogradskyella flava]MBC2844833.1 glycosyltransferase family 2 protein [Winogradskyella flava]